MATLFIKVKNIQMFNTCINVVIAINSISFRNKKECYIDIFYDMDIP